MLIYVDDIVITGSCDTTIKKIIATLADHFSLKDLGELSYFLGIEVYRSAQGLRLTQQKYTIDLLTRLNMTNAKPVAPPLASTTSLTLAGTKLPDPTEYRDVVGSLQYLSFTQPYIAFAVNRLSQFMHSPTINHWEAVKRVLRYLVGTINHGLFFDATSPLSLHAFSDADWVGDKDDYTSTGGYLIYLGKNPISWSSKKLKGVARSSTEAEYRTVSQTASEVKWLLSLLSELGVTSSLLPIIYCDNIGATYLCANPVFHSRMKHIALDYHSVREMIQSKILRVSHISSNDQLADALTKPLPRARFHDLKVKIGITSGASSCGGV